MNERIKLLAEQAESYAQTEYAKWIPTPDFSGVPHIRSLFNKKFAELIVEECAKVAVEAESTGVARLIMIHFGVEK